jgi:hypothetical protein
MKPLLSVLLMVLFYSGVAPTSNKKKVLIVPPSRFEFVSEFSLEEIAKLNEIEAPKVFLTYEKAILNAFGNYEDQNFEFVPIDAAGIKGYKRLIKYEYGKFEGRRYNSANLKSFKEAGFSNFLKQYDADFVIFITWYDIQKESFTRAGKHAKRVSYSSHYLDYDVFNLFKERIVGQGKVKAEGKEPNDLEASFKLLRVKELTFAYNNFIAKIIDQLNKPIEE